MVVEPRGLTECKLSDTDLRTHAMPGNMALLSCSQAELWYSTWCLTPGCLLIHYCVKARSQILFRRGGIARYRRRWWCVFQKSLNLSPEMVHFGAFSYAVERYPIAECTFIPHLCSCHLPPDIPLYEDTGGLSGGKWQEQLTGGQMTAGLWPEFLYVPVWMLTRVAQIITATHRDL